MRLETDAQLAHKPNHAPSHNTQEKVTPVAAIPTLSTDKTASPAGIPLVKRFTRRGDRRLPARIAVPTALDAISLARPAARNLKSAFDQDASMPVPFGASDEATSSVPRKLKKHKKKRGKKSKRSTAPTTIESQPPISEHQEHHERDFADARDEQESVDFNPAAVPDSESAPVTTPIVNSVPETPSTPLYKKKSHKKRGKRARKHKKSADPTPADASPFTQVDPNADIPEGSDVAESAPPAPSVVESAGMTVVKELLTPNSSDAVSEPSPANSALTGQPVSPAKKKMKKKKHHKKRRPAAHDTNYAAEAAPEISEFKPDAEPIAESLPAAAAPTAYEHPSSVTDAAIPSPPQKRLKLKHQRKMKRSPVPKLAPVPREMEATTPVPNAYDATQHIQHTPQDAFESSPPQHTYAAQPTHAPVTENVDAFQPEPFH